MGPIYSLDDFLDMVRRRAVLIAFVIFAGCIASVLWALSKPHLYSSSEVIQIEQPKIDSALAPTTVAGSSARRLQLIQQQLMARSTLLEIIAKYDLYDNLTALRPSEKVDLLRRSVTITGVAAAREGFSEDGTISVLTITAEMDSAVRAQAVAHEIADRTRALSAEQRTSQTRETLDFFLRQEENLSRDIANLEGELATFRAENDLSIEGSLNFRRAEVASLNDSLLELDRQIITTELARTGIDRSARAATVTRQERELDDQLESLRTQRALLAERRATLTESIETTPEVDRALANYERRMAQLQSQLDVTSARRNEAEVGFSLETDARGERLITIEEAQVPDYPITMSRKIRAIMGGGASVLAALVLALLLELRRPVIRTARQMERETGLMPVVSIPEAKSSKAPRRVSSLWQQRRAAGQKGRAARLARRN
ncbi:Uncharacterized protein involved in exopolysaccharide biosynthesis [Sulfitobacter brevis]|uniref:Uncharacterized protein involved in exopolysaccharide biosynthesis n=1 Tax=Sulfitobacter brevis TaxID=74348 RepID=A0A1I2APU5_9RHOB|nr:DUF874 domain-containing protein [Sulfitobacter brevis]SFE44900.1 Uncharacterized protein involved in exopolysaccharide biosynthesis [Sulfitobacter brevis]